jgi:type VI secretion system secreted protein Hcp
VLILDFATSWLHQFDHNPSHIIIRKRIDKASPLLIQAVAKNQSASGMFKFFRPNPTGDGTTQQFYTVEFEKGRVESVKQYVPDTIDPKTSTDPPMEEVIFSYTGISYSYLGATTGTGDGWKRG